MDAARAAGPMARALPLFYAASAAGRAIVAAHGDDVWRGRSHGLTQGAMGSPITGTTIRPLRQGLFHEVTRALNVPSLSDEVELGALWSAIPDLSNTPLEGSNWPRALFVRPRVYDQRGVSLTLGAESKATIVLHGVLPVASVTDDDYDWEAFFKPYPAAADLTLDSPPGGAPATHMTQRGWGIGVAWVDKSEAERRRAIERAFEHRFMQEHWLTPSVGRACDHLTPLALWWALLFGFSILARYEPTSWGAALDPDRSPLAVRIEDALEEALTAVPHLLLEGLTGGQVLLPRPAFF